MDDDGGGDVDEVPGVVRLLHQHGVELDTIHPVGDLLHTLALLLGHLGQWCNVVMMKW